MGNNETVVQLSWSDILFQAIWKLGSWRCRVEYSYSMLTHWIVDLNDDSEGRNQGRAQAPFRLLANSSLRASLYYWILHAEISWDLSCICMAGSVHYGIFVRRDLLHTQLYPLQGGALRNYRHRMDYNRAAVPAQHIANNHFFRLGKILDGFCRSLHCWNGFSMYILLGETQNSAWQELTNRHDLQSSLVAQARLSTCPDSICWLASLTSSYPHVTAFTHIAGAWVEISRYVRKPPTPTRVPSRSAPLCRLVAIVNKADAV